MKRKSVTTLKKQDFGESLLYKHQSLRRHTTTIQFVPEYLLASCKIIFSSFLHSGGLSSYCQTQKKLLFIWLKSRCIY